LIIKLITSCWDPNPKARPDFGLLSKHLESDIILLKVSNPTVLAAETMIKVHGSSSLQFKPVDLNSKSNVLKETTTSAALSAGANNASMTNASSKLASTKNFAKPPFFKSFYSKKKVYMLVAILAFVVVVVVSIVIVALVTQQRNGDSPLPSLTPPGSVNTNEQQNSITGMSFKASATKLMNEPSPTEVQTPSTSSAIAESAAKLISDSLTTTQLYSSLSTILTVSSAIQQASTAAAIVTPAATPTTAINITETPSVAFLLQNTTLLRGIRGLVLDSNDTIYAYSFTNNQIVKFREGLILFNADNLYPVVLATIATTASTVPSGRMCIRGNSIYIPASKIMWKVDLSNNSYVSRFAGSGVTGTAADGSRLTTARFNNALGCSFGDDGRMFVGDGNILRIIDTNGAVSTVPNFIFQTTAGMMVDYLGRLVMSDSSTNQIYRINVTDYSYSVIAGNGISSSSLDGQGVNSQVNQAMDFAEDIYGNLFFSEYGGQSIKIINTTGYVSRIAGNGGIGTAATKQFNFPYGLVFDKDGYLLIADSNNNAIQNMTFPSNFYYSSNETAPLLISVPPLTNNSKITVSTALKDINNFKFTYGIVIDSQNNIYTGTGATTPKCVYKISPTNIITRIGLTISPADIRGFCTRNNDLFIVTNSALYRMDLTTNAISLFSGNQVSGTTPKDGYTTAAVYDFAHDCAFDKSGTMYVADNKLIRKIDTNGYVSTVPINLACNGCAGIDFDADNQMFVTDFGQAKLFKVNLTDYSFITVAGSISGTQLDGQGTSSRLKDPNGIARDRYNNTFIADYMGNGVCWVNSTNYLRRIAGNGNAGYSDSGTVLLNNPSQVAFDSYGRLFVSEANGNDIRMITWN
jgi:sugar lactone lactonase YvrE